MSDGLIHFRCPICQARLATLAANADQTIECPGCDTRLVVPFEATTKRDDRPLYADEAALEFRAPEQRGDAELDMTPMVDVTFLLLIFFMVTAAFTMQKSFRIPAPDQEAPSTQIRQVEEEDGAIVVRIDEFSTFFVSAPNWDEEEEAPSEQELLRRLREAKQGDGHSPPPNTLIVEAHGDAMYEKVIMALDAGTEVGIQEVKLRNIDDDML